MPHPFTFLLLYAVIGLVTACGHLNGEQEQILRVVQLRANAMNSRNISQYMKIISPKYSDKAKDRQQLQEGLEAGFKVYDRVIYQADDHKVFINGKQAEVTGTYRMKVVIRGKEMVLNGKERLVLAKETDGWKIIAGL